MSVLTRFAPSPTGYLHIGNARAALFCWLYARAAGGQFLLRLDDTDTARVKPEYEQAIIEDLAWLGLTHDQLAKQSERVARYNEVFEDLLARGLVYPCFETPDELERKRKRQRARGQPPLYDRAALALSASEKQALIDGGRVPHYRFKLSGAQVAWDDMVRGAQSVATSSLSDPVLRRADGTYLYTLPSVIDDIDFGVSHVIRGEDHVTNTAAQIELIAALGGAAPIFAHFSLMLGSDGAALSKRAGALSLAELRARGLEAMSINALLARLGTPDPIIATHDLPALVAEFDITRLGRAAAKFDAEELPRLNAKILHAMPYDVAAARLKQADIAIKEDVWHALRENIGMLGEVRNLLDVLEGDVVRQDFTPEDKAFLAEALAALPDAPWDAATWGQWTGALQDISGRKGRALFMPLRRALTGREQGPEMHRLLPLIGRDKARQRLEIGAANA